MGALCGCQRVNSPAEPAPAAQASRAALWPETALVVDVRTPEEYASGHLAEAINVPHDQVADRLGEFGADKTRPIVVYCRSGRRSGIAREALSNAGFTNVINAGGYEELREKLGR
jgi:phage shock protein E